MDSKYPVFIMSLFGVCVIGSGMWRYFSAEGGHTGLWFGLVMGSLSWVAASLFLSGKEIPAQTIAWTCLITVGGWFCYESFVVKGIDNAETRQVVIIGATFASAGWLLASRFLTTKPGQKA